MFQSFLRTSQWSFWLLIVICFTGCASGRKTMDQRVKQATDNLVLIHKEPNRPWHPFNLLDHPILFVSFKESLLQRFVESELEELDFKRWSSKIPQTPILFDATTIDGQDYLVIHLDNYKNQSARNMTETVLHEGFHLFAQKEWSKGQQHKGRGTFYPFRAIPRYYRWEMNEHLKAYLSGRKPQDLQRFAYWFNRWKINFPEEYQNYTDCIEGSAQYYTLALMVILENKGVKQPLSAFQYYQTLNSPRFQDFFSLEAESYALGTLAGIVLDQSGNSDWQKPLSQGTSAIEILASRHRPLRDTVDHKIQNEFLQASLREMEKIDSDGKLDKIISDLANPKTIKMVIPSQGRNFSSFSSDGIYRSFFDFPGLKGVEMVSLSSTFRMSSPDLNFEWHPHQYWVTAQQQPCSDGHGTVFSFHSDEVTLTERLLVVHGESEQKYEGQLKKYKGTRLFCLPAGMKVSAIRQRQ